MKRLELTLLLHGSLEKVNPIACRHVRAMENDNEPLVQKLEDDMLMCIRRQAKRLNILL